MGYNIAMVELTSADAGRELSPEDLLKKKFARVIQYALSRSRNAVILHTGESGLTDQDIIPLIPDTFFVQMVDQLLNGQVVIPRSKTGLAVLGYEQARSPDEEWMLQAKIRSETVSPNREPGGFSILVCTRTLPRVDLFEASFPWFNGPFQSDAALWSVVPGQGMVKLSQFSLSGGMYSPDRKWTPQATFQL